MCPSFYVSQQCPLELVRVRKKHEFVFFVQKSLFLRVQFESDGLIIKICLTPNPLSL